jgi:hypothetical protein
MNYTEQLQDWGVMLLLTAAFYVFAGYLARSLHPAGTLNWRGRRYRMGGALFLLLFFVGCEVLLLYQGHEVGITAVATLYAALGLLLLLLIRWWWQDARRERAAREALVEKLHEEGRELVAPPMSTRKKAWRWVVNVYAIFLVAAGLYALLHYLVVKFL